MIIMSLKARRISVCAQLVGNRKEISIGHQICVRILNFDFIFRCPLKCLNLLIKYGPFLDVPCSRLDFRQCSLFPGQCSQFPAVFRRMFLVPGYMFPVPVFIWECSLFPGHCSQFPAVFRRMFPVPGCF